MDESKLEMLVEPCQGEDGNTTNCETVQEFAPVLDNSNMANAHCLVDDRSDFDEDPSLSSSYSDDDGFDDYEGNTFQECLRTWAKSTKISENSLDELLAIIRKKSFADVPKDANTFLQGDLDDGQLWYDGIEKTIRHYFRNYTELVDVLEINISLEGRSIVSYKTTRIWPILMELRNIPQKPVLVVGLFCGSPLAANRENYLRPLVIELNHLCNTKLNINPNHLYGKVMAVRLKAIIADAPARAFMTGLNYHQANRTCYKCICDGTYDSDELKVTFPGVAGVPRTDEKFRNGTYGEEHRLSKPLLELNSFNAIQDVVVGDGIAVMRKLLLGWAESELEPFPKWSSKQKQEIDKMLLRMRFPSEIEKELRVLHYALCWTGSELHTFLHYASIAILKDKIDSAAYEHFKLFYCAMTILSSTAYKQRWQYAGECLVRFVEQFDTFYKSHLTSVVHNLLHLTAEVLRFGPIPSIFRYSFDAKLRFIKGLVKEGNHPLGKVVSSLSEVKETCSEESKKYPLMILDQQELGIILHLNSKFMLKRGKRDGWFLTKENIIVKYTTASLTEGKPLEVHGHPIFKKSATFSTPCSSA
uniref:Transposase domain-containing protein n=1 Tax=Anopheles atroparvus TaxID=41427 RepID=A0AAG5CQR8_ANOAO